jgi:hypothetical protein
MFELLMDGVHILLSVSHSVVLVAVNSVVK